MPYIPKEHEKYNLLPWCREHGGEVFDYPSKLICEMETLLGTSVGLLPYGYYSYEEYYGLLDQLIISNQENKNTVEKLNQLKQVMMQMNQKEEWSVLKYVGPTDEGALGLTNGKNYYWPTRREKPIYNGVIDDEEFTSYMYPTESFLWEILEDPTGMAYDTIYGDSRNKLSQKDYNRVIERFSSAVNKIE